MNLCNVNDQNEKSIICDYILRALPDWFGVESSIIEYIEKVKTLPFYAAFENENPIGFVAIKKHNFFASEIFVMGVLKNYHRQGIGKKLIGLCEEYCKENNIEFLTVKTLDESRKDESYAKTRLFYLSMGFRPIEVFPTLWDENNPCLLMAKFISKTASF